MSVEDGYGGPRGGGRKARALRVDTGDKLVAGLNVEGGEVFHTCRRIER